MGRHINLYDRETKTLSTCLPSTGWRRRGTRRGYCLRQHSGETAALSPSDGSSELTRRNDQRGRESHRTMRPASAVCPARTLTHCLATSEISKFCGLLSNQVAYSTVVSTSHFLTLSMALIPCCPNCNQRQLGSPTSPLLPPALPQP